MKNIYLTIALLIFVFNHSFAQQFRQYFDGADTIFNPNFSPSAIRVVMDDDSTNIWQIGKPQKVIFDSSATYPNALITDTLNNYPINNTSSFQFTIVPWSWSSIIAIQWKQKLDMDSMLDGGKIEFSVDSGTTWQNAFNNPYVYNFYGFDTANVDTMLNGEYVFTGTDSVWRDIWLCYSMSWLSTYDSLMVRFTFLSDSLDNNNEGWMIDNLMAHTTVIHTVKETEKDNHLRVYPNPASDIVHIETEKLMEFHIIEEMKLVDKLGRVVDKWTNIPTKFWFDVGKYQAGNYLLVVKTNVKSETLPLVISRR